MGFVVAIDGPAGSGKGTVTEILAKKLKLNSIDTGAMYRCVTLAMIRNNVDISNIEKVMEVLNNINIDLQKANNQLVVKLNGEDVSYEWEELLESGLPKGILEYTGERHPSFNLGKRIEQYIDKHIDKKINEVLRKF